MKYIKNFYRKNFCSRGKRLLLELTDSKADLLFGIVLEEVGLPGGHITLHRWWKTKQASFYERVNFVRISGDGISDGIVERDLSEFDNVLTCLDSVDRLNLRNMSSNFRDGVVYSLAWGTGGQLRSIAIENPTDGSPYKQLVKTMENCRWE